MTTRVLSALLAIATALLPSCGENGSDPYAGWDTWESTAGGFSVRYLSPPWTACTGTEFEADCHECPSQLLGAGICGDSGASSILWIPPALLDPDFLLIPPYKLEVSWWGGASDALTLAQNEQNVMTSVGLTITVPARLITLADGTVGAEVGYGGPMHIIVDETAVNRPDERDFRVVYVSSAAMTYRVAIDSAIDITSPEVLDMLASFSTGVTP
jgi:hypothetical protein